MKSRWIWMIAIGTAASVSVFFLGCGDDGTTTGGGPMDTDPPMVAGVTAVDGFHIDVMFNEIVDKGTAEVPENYIAIEQSPALLNGPRLESAAPGDTIFPGSAVLKADGMTVGLTLFTSMSNVPYNLEVSGVRDASGNEITTTQSFAFTGSGSPDTTPPEIVSRTPAPGATMVGIGQSVVVEFSEPMNFTSVTTNFTWSWNVGMVGYTSSWQAANIVVFTPTQPLLTNTTYTATFGAGASDLFGNTLAPTSWNFMTMPMADTTRPTFVSSVPTNGQVNVATDVVLQMTFSEPIDPISVEAGEGPSILVFPDPGDGILTWTAGGATLNFEPFMPLIDNQQYTITIPEGAVSDVAGNPLQGSTVITFSTGAALPTGRFSGTVSGDPTSVDAQDPTGAVVIASANNFLSGSNDEPQIIGAAVVGGGGSYSVNNLPDDWYFPASFMDSNGDGQIDPGLGDAFGAYGVDIAGSDVTPDSVQITGGGQVTGVDFPLWDAIAIGGTVTYIGSAYNPSDTPVFYVGVFDTTGFDPTSSPDYGTGSASILFDPTFRFGELENGLVDGTYYVAAFLDVGFNGTYDPLTDPAGIYSDGLGVPIAVTVEQGQDAIGLLIEMDDPFAPLFSWPAGWTPREPSGDLEARRAFAEMMKEVWERYRSER